MEIEIETSERRQVVDITDQINGNLPGDVRLVHLFVQHTTAALAAADLDPGTDLDMLEALEKMVPKLRFRHPHDPEHTPDHILATLIGPDLTVPVRKGRLALGDWQRVVLFEFDGPRQRRVMVSLEALKGKET